LGHQYRLPLDYTHRPVGLRHQHGQAPTTHNTDRGDQAQTQHPPTDLQVTKLLKWSAPEKERRGRHHRTEEGHHRAGPSTAVLLHPHRPPDNIKNTESEATQRAGASRMGLAASAVGHPLACAGTFNPPLNTPVSCTGTTKPAARLHAPDLFQLLQFSFWFSYENFDERGRVCLCCVIGLIAVVPEPPKLEKVWLRELWKLSCASPSPPVPHLAPWEQASQVCSWAAHSHPRPRRLRPRQRERGGGSACCRMDDEAWRARVFFLPLVTARYTAVTAATAGVR
jgi:hypothetical protein